jgi:preprotein translocase subunit SecF
MEIFKNPNYNFLGWKWPFIILSLLLSVSGQISMVAKGGPKYGIDFRGGTLVYVKFKDTPPEDRLRTALHEHKLGDSTIQRFGPAANHEIIISVDQTGKQEDQLAAARVEIINTLPSAFALDQTKLDINNAGRDTVAERLTQSAGLSPDDARKAADGIMAYRNANGGIVATPNDVRNTPGVTPAVVASLEKDFVLAPYTVRNVEIVGPKVGDELRHDALFATLYALAGMLLYVAFRFEWVYGVAAIIATFHDVIITLGFFSIFNVEITLPVVAALLTLVGYSMNDTIVVFDRIRENIKSNRRESLAVIANLSINQTLSRTILTSGLTFVTVLCLFFFGGEVLRGFSFALTVGILIGTYSSIAIAAPIVVVWQQWWDRRANSGKVIALESKSARGGARVKQGAR